MKFLSEETSYEKIRDFVKEPNLVSGHGYCLLHGKDCVHLTAEIHVAGIICISWSPMGDGKKSGGSDYPLYASWVICRRHFQDIFVLICFDGTFHSYVC